MTNRLEIDGRDVTEECDSFQVTTPRLVYSTDDGKNMLRFLGPQGFQLIVTNPSDGLRALAGDTDTVRQVKVAVEGHSITHPTQFRREWVDQNNGERKLFGCLASNRDNEAQWLKEGV